MFAEYLEDCGLEGGITWVEIQPGIRVCCFTLPPQAEGKPRVWSPDTAPCQGEALFCSSGKLTLVDQDGYVLQTGEQKVLLLAGQVLAMRQIELSGPVKGVLVSADGEQIRRAPGIIHDLLSLGIIDAERGWQNMRERGGYAVMENGIWCRSVFDHLSELSAKEQGGFALLKAMELFYLLCAAGRLPGEENHNGSWDSSLDQTIFEMRNYMESHLEDKLTIAALSHRFCVAPTAFKRRFRQLYGQPVHGWLKEQRMEHATELLKNTSMSILQISQAVGYAGPSQFNVAFKQRYGLPPKQYIKMSKLGKN